MRGNIKNKLYETANGFYSHKAWRGESGPIFAMDHGPWRINEPVVVGITMLCLLWDKSVASDNWFLLIDAVTA